MLSSLHIDNMAVIKSLELAPGAGFTVMTGETGAGKSIIIDSINFLLCHRIVRDLIRTGEQKAAVSALFTGIDPRMQTLLSELGVSAENGELCLERSLSADGKSVCRIDGRTVSQQLLRSAGQLLISIHGQNDSQKLASPLARLSVIDTLAHSSALTDEYSALYAAWNETRARIEDLKRSEKEKYQLRDMLEYQIRDIASYKLKSGEEEALLEEQKKLESLERIKKQTDIALRALYKNEKGITASYLTERAGDALSRISDVIPEYGPLSDRLRACRYELDDIADEISARAFDITDGEDPGKRLDKIGARLESFKKLKKKYAPTIEEIIAYAAQAEAKLAELDNAESIMEELSLLEQQQLASLRRAADALSEVRRNAADSVEKEISETLKYLDMPKVRFAISMTRTSQPRPDGQDLVDFMLSANAGEPMQPLEKTASGGELSRVMLAIKCAVSGADGIPTIIFDEIDTGISGSTSRKVGIKLKQASRSAQVLCVTHSAQIASLGDLHLRISKSEVDGRTQTALSVLDEDGRIEETARILGGIRITDAQRQAAIDMINEGKNI